MGDDIPLQSDLIVVGTGLVESIVAAAASRIGKQVIHLDHRDFYGSNWASFSFNNLENALGLSTNITNSQNEGIQNENDPEILIVNYSNPVQNVEEKWNVRDNLTEDPENLINNEDTDHKIMTHQWTKSEILKYSRKFNFDLSPKVLYSRGEMVDILISSGICRYAEFKNISAIYCYDHVEGNLLSVPCSRADVFNSKDITMIEKRLLMKTLSLCVEYEKKSPVLQDFEKFGDFLNHHKVQGKVRQYIIESVAMVEESTVFSEAMIRIQKFVRSIGRYGNTPFLWTLYGSGELPQCFCRCSAVFGGIYCLKRPIQGIKIDSDGQAIGIESQGQTLQAKFFLIEDCLNPQAIVKSGFSRAILVIDRSITGNDQVALINFSSVDGKEPVRILELSASTMACPKGLYVVHLTTRQVLTASEDLKFCIDTLFSEDINDCGPKPKILWSLYFNMNEYESTSNRTPSNLYFGSGPNSAIDFDHHVLEAKHIFQSMFPDDEFLPRVPDPEDIILEGQEQIVEVQDQSAEAQKQTAEAQNQTAEAQNQTAEAQNQTAEAQNQTAEAQNQTAEAQNQTAEAQNQTVEAQNQTVEAQDQSAEGQKSAS